MSQEIELRWRKTQGLFVPQRKDKNGTWVDFEVEKLPRDMKLLAQSIANYESRTNVNVNIAFSDTNGLYFREEFLLKAFLAAAREFYSVEINEFDVFDEESKTEK